MSDYRAKTDSVKTIPSMLFECRELMTSHLKQSLPNMMDEVDDVLLDIAVKTTNSSERTKYFNAMYEVREKRFDIEKKCVENFIALFTENIRVGKSADSQLDFTSGKNTIAMSNAVNKVRNNCHQALLKLDQHMCEILKTKDLDAKKNPISPEVVCKAFYDACDLVDSETEIRLIIFKYFERCVAALLNNVYSEIESVIEAGGSSRESRFRNLQVATNQTVTQDKDKDKQKPVDVHQVVTLKVKVLIQDKHVPEFVSDFVLNHWVRLLVRIYNKNGMDSDAWRHAIETVEDLVWSVGSVTAKKDRDRFDKLWPDLIKRLRNGIKMVSITPREETDFISGLLKHRATLTMLGALAKSKDNDVTLVTPEKLKELKLKLKAASEQSIAKNIDMLSIGSEDVTIPALDMRNLSRPFMDELLVDNHKVEGFKQEDKDKD